MLVGIWSRQAAWRAKVFVVAVHLQCSHFRPFFFFFLQFPTFCRERHRSCLVVTGLSKSQRAARDFVFSPHTSLGATYGFFASFLTCQKSVIIRLVTPTPFAISVFFLFHSFVSSTYPPCPFPLFNYLCLIYWVGLEAYYSCHFPPNLGVTSVCIPKWRNSCVPRSSARPSRSRAGTGVSWDHCMQAMGSVPF